MPAQRTKRPANKEANIYPKPRPTEVVIAELLAEKTRHAKQFTAYLNEAYEGFIKFEARIRETAFRLTNKRLIERLYKLLQDIDPFNSPRRNNELAADFVAICINKLATPFVPEPNLNGFELALKFYIAKGGCPISARKAKSGTPIKLLDKFIS